MSDRRSGSAENGKESSKERNDNEQIKPRAIVVTAIAVVSVPAAAWAQSTVKVRPSRRSQDRRPTMVTSDYMVHNHGYMVLRHAVFLQDEGAIKPQMVSSFAASPDGLSWAFVLVATSSSMTARL